MTSSGIFCGESIGSRRRWTLIRPPLMFREDIRICSRLADVQSAVEDRNRSTRATDHGGGLFCRSRRCRDQRGIAGGGRCSKTSVHRLSDSPAVSPPAVTARRREVSDQTVFTRFVHWVRRVVSELTSSNGLSLPQNGAGKTTRTAQSRLVVVGLPSSTCVGTPCRWRRSGRTVRPEHPNP